MLPSGQHCRDYIYDQRITNLHYIGRFPDLQKVDGFVPNERINWFVIPAHLPYRQALKPVINKMQEDNVNNRSNITPLVISLLKYCDDWRQALESYVIAGRKWVADINEDEIPIPSLHEMRVFYECGRKHVYLSEQEAENHLEGPNHVYSCSWCGNWHQGRPAKNPPTHNIQMSRWLSVWKRYYFKKLSKERTHNLKVSE